MATYLRLFPATNQFALTNGQLNVAGRLHVFYEGTDDRAALYDENGTLLSNPVILDNDGRAAGLFVDASKVYWIRVCDRDDAQVFTVRKMVPSGGGAGSALGNSYSVVSTDGTVEVNRYSDAGVITFDISTRIEEQSSPFGGTISMASSVEGDNEWHELPVVSSQGEISYVSGWNVQTDCVGDIAASVEMSSGDPAALHTIDVMCQFLVDGTAVVTEYGMLDPTEPNGRVTFEWKGALLDGNRVDCRFYVRSRGAATVGLVGRALYNEEVEGVIGNGGSGEYYGGDYIEISGQVINATGLQPVSGMTAYQTTAGMSAYQPSGNYQTAGDYASSSDLLDYQPTSSMGDYQLTADMTAYMPISATAGLFTGVETDSSITGNGMSGSALGVNTAVLEPYQKSADMSAYQPSGDYVSSSEMADYATTAALAEKLDSSASSAFITSTADCMPLASSSEFYSTSNPAGYITGVDLSPYAESSSLSAYQETSGMSAYQTVAGMTAYQSAGDYATTAQLAEKLDSSASSAFITSTANCQPSGDYVSSSELADYQPISSMGAYQTTAGMTAYQPSGDYVSSSDMSAYQETSGMSAYQTTAGMSAYQASGDYVSSSEMSAYQTVSGMSAYQTAGDYVSSSELANYQTTAGMSAYQSAGDYATTAELAEKLDSSASSVFITSTADCMPLASSSEFYSTSNPAGYITGVDLTPYAESSSLSAYQETSGMSAYQTVAGMSAYQPSGNYQPSGDYVSSSELADYQTTAGMSSYMPTSSASAFMPASANPFTGVTTDNTLTGNGLSSSALGVNKMELEFDSSMSTSVSANTATVGVNTAILSGYQESSSMSAYQTVAGMTAYQTAGDYVSSSELANYQTTAGMTAYATTADLSAKLDASASSSFITSTADCMPLSASADFATTGDLSAKLDASASSAFITSTAGLATTADVAEKLDSSASSAFVTSTADCMPLSASSNYASTSDLSAKLDTSAIETSTAGVTAIAGTAIAGGGGGGGTTYTAGQYIQISGDEISVTGIDPASYARSSSLADYQTTAGMSAYASTADLSAKLDASASSAFLTAQVQTDWNETASGSPAYLANKPSEGTLSAGDYINISSSGSTVTIEATGLLPESASSSFQPSGDYVEKSASNLAIGSGENSAVSGDTLTQGSYNTADQSSMAQGNLNSAIYKSLAQGFYNNAGYASFAQGNYNTAHSDSMVQGTNNSATGTSVAIGSLNSATDKSLAQGFCNTASGTAVVFGKYNADGQGTGGSGIALAFGDGTAPGSRHNLFEFRKNGTLTIYSSTGDMSGVELVSTLTGKLDASASSSFITSTADCMPLSASGNYATTADLSAKLDASASSAFITSTAGLVSTGDLSSYLETSSIGVDTASAITSIAGSSIAGGGGGASYTAGQYIQISGDEISVTGINPGDYAQSSSLADYQTTAGMSGYATTADLSAKLDVSASSAFLTAQEQASWSETASSSPSYIADKPDLVDIVAGPGIVVDNPDGNTLRVSMAQDYETVLWNDDTDPAAGINGTRDLSESVANFEKIAVYFWRCSDHSQTYRYYQINTVPVINGTANFATFWQEATAWFKMFLRISGTTATFREGHYTNAGLTDTLTETAMYSQGNIYRIVGIHRIASN